MRMDFRARTLHYLYRKSTRFRKQHDKTSLASKYTAPSTASADSDFGGIAANNNSRGACFENAR